MSDNRKYYYLKFKENFFDSEAMIILESMPDGYLYSNILIKLYLRSLKNEGKLMFNNTVPYNPTILAQVVRHSVGVVEKSLSLFKQLGLIEILDNGAIYMLDIQNYIGQSSSEADRQRDYQLRIKQDMLGFSEEFCKKSNRKSTPEKEIELKTDIKIELEIKPEFINQTNWELFCSWWKDRLIKHRNLRSTKVALTKQLNIIKNLDNSLITEALQKTISGDANGDCYQNIIIPKQNKSPKLMPKRSNDQIYTEDF